MKINKLYTYPKSMRSVINGGRHYDIGGNKLPSVTTILSACQSPEKKASLAAWKLKMGAGLADKVRDLAAARGYVYNLFIFISLLFIIVAYFFNSFLILFRIFLFF